MPAAIVIPKYNKNLINQKICAKRKRWSYLNGISLGFSFRLLLCAKGLYAWGNPHGLKVLKK